MIVPTLLALAGVLMQDSAALLRPDAVLGEDGHLHEGWQVAIRNGAIEAIGPDLKAPAGGDVFHLSGVLAPGFVDAWSWNGCDAAEESLRLSPNLLAADGIDNDSDSWGDRLDAGITTVQLLPRPTNTLAGWAAVVTSSGPEIVSVRSRQVVSLLPKSVGDDRKGPLGLPGALEDLSTALLRVQGVSNSGAIALV